MWLLPGNADDAYLRKIIEELSQRYGAPTFSPHITALGGIDVSLDVVEEILKNRARGLSPFSVKNLGLEFSDSVFRAAYLSLEPSHQLEEVNSRLARTLDSGNSYSFKPHISLLYKVVSAAERRRVASEFEIKGDFTVERIAVAEIVEKVEDWKTHLVMNLGVT